MTKTDERNKFLTDVLITAVEGGIGYWSQIEGYDYDNADALKRGGLLYISGIERKDIRTPIARIDEDEDLGTVYIVHLNLGTIVAGVLNILKDEFNVNALIRDIVRVANRQNDAAPDDGPGDIDAEVADVIVQAGIFGKIIFG